MDHRRYLIRDCRRDAKPRRRKRHQMRSPTKRVSFVGMLHGVGHQATCRVLADKVTQPGTGLVGVCPPEGDYQLSVNGESFPRAIPGRNLAVGDLTPRARRDPPAGACGPRFGLTLAASPRSAPPRLRRGNGRRSQVGCTGAGRLGGNYRPSSRLRADVHKPPCVSKGGARHLQSCQWPPRAGAERPEGGIRIPVSAQLKKGVAPPAQEPPSAAGA
jgi:hypothetical protein